MQQFINFIKCVGGKNSLKKILKKQKINYLTVE